MSNLREWLVKRRGKFYEGVALQQVVDAFLAMIDRGAEVHEHPGAIIVLEDYMPEQLGPNVVRAWLLFDRFSSATVSAMRKVIREFPGRAIVAETHDPRMCQLLTKLGFVLVYHDGGDYHLICKGGS